jgi:hypothetical protein
VLYERSENMNLRLKAKIIECYGSQANFSQVVGKPEPVISRVVHGRIQLSPEERIQWSRLLDASSETLFGVMPGSGN